MELHSFSQFIGEAGIYQGGLTSLPIKALVKARETNAYKILEFIFRAGLEGRRYMEIVKFAVEELAGDTFDKVNDRGRYSNHLSGLTQPGLLHLYCEKTRDGKWRLNSETMSFFKSEDDLYKNLSQKEVDIFSKLMSKREK
jgi:hypothetical protein